FRSTVATKKPLTSDFTVNAFENQAFTFHASDFPFSDPNDNPANSLLAVKVVSLPTAGVLTDGSVNVTAGQFVSVSDINNGLLKYQPLANSTASTSFT